MQKDITIKAYTFDELSEKAKDKARAWFNEGNLWDQRYSPTFEDAKQAGITIDDFETDAWENVFNMRISLDDGALNTMNYILDNHGEHCDTYKAALDYQNAIDALPDLPVETAANYREVHSALCEGADAIEGEFIQALEKCYTRMLKQEFEDMRSNDYIDETILANEYWFNEHGERFAEADK